MLQFRSDKQHQQPALQASASLQTISGWSSRVLGFQG
jgi:hypothetical protein